MVGFEKALRAVKVIKDQIMYRSHSLLNVAHGYFSDLWLIESRLISYFSVMLMNSCGKFQV